MKYGDFSSLVQLGVGLHIGTALFQLYGEFGMQPLVRTLARIKSMHDDKEDQLPDDLREEVNDLEGRFEIFKIQFFNEYKKYFKINSLAAVLLLLLLIVLAYLAEEQVAAEWTVLIVALSALPAPVTLAALWLDAANAIKPITKLADDLEARIQKC